MQDVSELDSSLSFQRLNDSILCDSVSFASRSMSPYADGPMSNSDTAVITTPHRPRRKFWLPLHNEATEMLSKFASDVYPYVPIIHRPSLPVLIDDMYQALSRGSDPHVGAVLLLLSICTSACYTWTLQDDYRGIYCDPIEATKQSTLWLRAALDLVDHCDRIGHTSLECLQGMVVLFWVLCSAEGVSMRARSLAAGCISMAQSLGIHRIDQHVNSLGNRDELFTVVEAEMSRRVWWFLVASNWMHSQFSLLHGKLYNNFLASLMVRRPCNIDDDMLNGQEPVSLPSDTATSVSYLLQRIRLEEICHDISDASGSMLIRNDAEYNRILEIDKRLQKFERELPPFFAANKLQGDALSDRGQRYRQAVSTQRFLLNFVLHRQRCQMHLPYFIKGITEPKFETSHNACVESASIIIHLEQQLRGESLPFATVRRRMNIKLRSIFVATIILVLSACVEADQDASNGRQELDQVFTLLSEIGEEAPFAARLRDFALEMLTRNQPAHPVLSRVPCLSATGIHALTPATALLAVETQDEESGVNGGVALNLNNEDGNNDLDLQWDAILNQIGLGPDIWRAPTWMRETQM
ncbi:hypothetical protein NLG97_g4019 [Lecanicillium saksenae]|uniref:Uncharacterized protein n=1 Tax=Lecanicillium saksenae TaxID=468837 RepID=A0ACC1R0C7_9HYPO|nr:hypothetical protein NLG97_g4019 [Lecanicillium saksenae]